MTNLNVGGKRLAISIRPEVIFITYMVPIISIVNIGSYFQVNNNNNNNRCYTSCIVGTYD